MSKWSGTACRQHTFVLILIKIRKITWKTIGVKKHQEKNYLLQLVQWTNSPLRRLLLEVIPETCRKQHNGLSNPSTQFLPRKHICPSLQELLSNYYSLQILLYIKEMLCWQNNVLTAHFTLPALHLCPQSFVVTLDVLQISLGSVICAHVKDKESLQEE